MSAPEPRCGRLDAHEPHDWTRPKYANAYVSVVQARTHHCPGAPVIEGGWTRCEGCHTSGRPHDVDGEECREAAVEKAISQGDV